MKFTSMGPFAGADDADIAAARPLPVDGAVELDLEADEVPFVDRRSAEHIELAHGLSSTTSTLRYIGMRLDRPRRMVLRRAPSATASGLEPTRHSSVLLPLSSVTMIANSVMAISPALRTTLGS